MTFDDLNINEKIKDRLKAAVQNERVFHAYIFEGDACTGKKEIATSFAKAILCESHKGEGCNDCLVCKKIEHGNHEDLLVIEQEGSIKDENIEDMQERLKNKPLGERNIALIANADTMTLRAQNRLLKTLEEPPQGTVIVLLSENVENLIMTIRSRCVIYRFTGDTAGANEEMISLAKEIKALLLEQAPFYLLSRKVKHVAEDRNMAFALLDALEITYSHMLLDCGGCVEAALQEYIYWAVSAIEVARRNLQRNINAAYVLKCLILKIGG